MGGDFRLGDCIVRPQRDCVECGGGTVHVKPKSMAVLACLAESPGEVVTRRQLFESVWPGASVSDDVLTHCIMELRRSFGDSAQDPRFIETIPKVGFRLLPDVIYLEQPTAESPGLASGRPGDVFRPPVRLALVVASCILLSLVALWHLGGSAKLPPAGPGSDQPSLAILPFVDMSEAADQDWYAHGLTEELINRVAQLDGLKVAAMTASFSYLGSNEDPRAIAEALGVGHLLEGSVRIDGNRVRITAQLIEAEQGFHLWSKQFDRDRGDLFEVQEEIAEKVAGLLSVQFRVGQLGTQPGGTGSVEAWELYRQAREYQWEATPDSMLQANDLARQATEVDPDYAQAWYLRAGLYVNSREIVGPVEGVDWLQLAREALQRALEIEPGLKGPRHLATIIQFASHDWAGAEETMNHGAGLELSNDFNLLAGWVMFLHRVGRITEAIPFHERKKRLIPSSNGTALGLSWCYVIVGRVEEGVAEAERAWTLEGFDTQAAINGLQISLALRDRELIHTWLARASTRMPGSSLLAAMEHTLDDSDAALAELHSAFEAGEDEHGLLITFALFHGDTELALAATLKDPDPLLFWGTDMRPVRSLPGFRDAVRSVGLENYFREYGWNDFCRPLGADDFECR